jgi:hypothetical protein
MLKDSNSSSLQLLDGTVLTLIWNIRADMLRQRRRPGASRKGRAALSLPDWQ